MKYASKRQIRSDSIPPEPSFRPNLHHNNGLNFGSQGMESHVARSCTGDKMGAFNGVYALLHRAYAILHLNGNPNASTGNGFCGSMDFQSASGAGPPFRRLRRETACNPAEPEGNFQAQFMLTIFFSWLRNRGPALRLN